MSKLNSKIFKNKMVETKKSTEDIPGYFEQKIMVIKLFNEQEARNRGMSSIVNGSKEPKKSFVYERYHLPKLRLIDGFCGPIQKTISAFPSPLA